MVANVVGAVVVTALVGWVLPRPDPLSDSMVVANAVAIPIYIAAAVVVGVVWGTRTALSKVAWVLDDREPTPEEQREALRAPLGLVRVQVVLWAVAVAVFSLIAQAVQPTLTSDVAVTVSLGGVVTVTASYLLTELLFRPVSARALANDPPRQTVVPGVQARWLLAWALGSGVPITGLVVVGVLALVRGDTSPTQLAVTMLALGAVGLVVGLLLAWLAVRATVDPIRSLRTAAEQVERGDLRSEVVVYDASEVGLLQAAFNRMVAGLQERERIRDLFGRHVGEDVARQALAAGVDLGGEGREIGVLFVDVVGSTRLASERTPTEVVDLLNRFFGAVIAVVTECAGSVNKFEGDAVLAVFGAPVAIEDHAGAALRAARLLDGRLREAIPELGAGIGVACGSAVAGNVGAQERLEYTVIGDPVNEAARLSDLAKAREPRVVASMACVDCADDEERSLWSPAESVTLRGRSEPTRLAIPT